MMGEDAGRDPRYLSPYLQGNVFAGVGSNGIYYATTTEILTAGQPQRSRPCRRCGPVPSVLALVRARRELWCFRPAKQQVSSLDHEPTAWLTAGPFIAQGNNAGNNDELASFRPSGVNILMGDGSVRFLKALGQRRHASRSGYAQWWRGHLRRPVLTCC